MLQLASHSHAIVGDAAVARMARFPSLPQHRDYWSHPRHLSRCAKKPPFSPAAYRQITRPLIRPDGSFDRRKITADARFRFQQARRFRDPISWSKAMTDAWDLAHRQIALARSFDATPLPFAA